MAVVGVELRPPGRRGRLVREAGPRRSSRRRAGSLEGKKAVRQGEVRPLLHEHPAPVQKVGPPVRPLDL